MNEPSPAAAPAPPPSRPSLPAYALLAGLALLLCFGLWGLWRVLSGGDPESPARLREQLEALEQQVATLTRSDQISRDANRDLQVTLAERDEEIAALRADVAFYERFVGATAQRRGLSVHEIALRPQAGQAWHYTATLTQNLNRGSVSSGALTLWLEGMHEGRLQRLAWADLRQQPQAPGREYSFKYFQQVEGEIVLPEGFEPLRLGVRLAPASGAAVEQAFSWADVAAVP